MLLSININNDLFLNQKESEIRKKRDSLLMEIDWRLQRYHEQKQLGIPTNDTDEQFIEMLRYKQKLRDIPNQDSFPQEINWPSLSF